MNVADILVVFVEILAGVTLLAALVWALYASTFRLAPAAENLQPLRSAIRYAQTANIRDACGEF